MSANDASASERDQRKYQRVPLSAEALVQCAGREYLLTSRNLSLGGMQANPQPDLPSSVEGFISFHLKPEDLPVACHCRVIYSIDGRGVGIEFLDLTDDLRLMLKNFVDEAN
ncbi:MAG TPA: PilZ domain-containing protein [Terriglobia bacterium]|nr:PilZ domain-containing protein [Terriglobia bacterium]